MSLNQHELVIEFIKEKGSILPAKMSGFIYKNHMMGSEISKRCRELRARGVLRSQKEGKFERFFLAKPIQYRQLLVKGPNGEIEKILTLPI